MLTSSIPEGGPSHRVFNMDIVDLLSDPEFRQGQQEDILYIDPPYVSREYAPNYHLYDAAVAPTDTPVRGVTGLPESYPRSEFCRPVEAVEAFLVRVLQRTRARLVVISYSSDSTVPLPRMMNALFEGGCLQVETHAKPYRRFRADSSEEREYNDEPLLEFLIVGRKGGSDNMLSLLGE